MWGGAPRLNLTPSLAVSVPNVDPHGLWLNVLGFVKIFNFLICCLSKAVLSEQPSSLRCTNTPSVHPQLESPPCVFYVCIHPLHAPSS